MGRAGGDIGSHCGGGILKRDDVDFHEVRDEHLDIHGRLVNWARWASGGRGGASTSPMFRQYRSNDHWAAPDVSQPVDRLDAAAMEKAVVALPERYRVAIVWSYIKCYHGMSIRKACFALAVSPDGLAALVHDGRTMLKNRCGSEAKSPLPAPSFLC